MAEPENSKFGAADQEHENGRLRTLNQRIQNEIWNAQTCI